MVEVGDRFTGSYEQCGDSVVHTTSNTTSVQCFHNTTTTLRVLCSDAREGRDIRVRAEGQTPDVCDVRHSGWRMNDIAVHGYQPHMHNKWGAWGMWSACTVSLGSGVRRRQRNCTEATAVKCLVPNTKMRKNEDFDEEMCVKGYVWIVVLVIGLVLVTINITAFSACHLRRMRRK